MRESTVVFLQGAGAGAHAADRALALSLGGLLGDGYRIGYPEMPGEDDPDYGRWKARISRELDDIQGDLILVAHSAGGPLLIRYLSDVSGPEVSGLFLMAPPFFGEGGQGVWAA